MHEEIKLGNEVKDSITGFIGIVTARCEYLNASTRCLVSPKIGKNNKMGENHWINEGRLEVIK